MRATTVEFAQRQVWHALHAIPPTSAEAVAALFVRLAEELRHVADEHRRKEKMARSVRNALDRLAEIPAMISRRLADGMSLADAKADVARVLDAPADTVELYWRRYEIKRPRIERSRTAVRMRAAGYSNAEIARALACSTRTVARLLSHPL